MNECKEFSSRFLYAKFIVKIDNYRNIVADGSVLGRRQWNTKSSGSNCWNSENECNSGEVFSLKELIYWVGEA